MDQLSIGVQGCFCILTFCFWNSAVFFFHRGMFPFVIGVGSDINKLCFQFIIQDSLAGVKTGVTGEHVTQRTGKGIVEQTFPTEKFHCEKGGSNGTVDGTAKDTDQADGCSET